MQARDVQLLASDVAQVVEHHHELVVAEHEVDAPAGLRGFALEPVEEPQCARDVGAPVGDVAEHGEVGPARLPVQRVVDHASIPQHGCHRVELAVRVAEHEERVGGPYGDVGAAPWRRIDARRMAGRGVVRTAVVQNQRQVGAVAERDGVRTVGGGARLVNRLALLLGAEPAALRGCGDPADVGGVLREPHVQSVLAVEAQRIAGSAARCSEHCQRRGGERDPCAADPEQAVACHQKVLIRPWSMRSTRRRRRLWTSLSSAFVSPSCTWLSVRRTPRPSRRFSGWSTG